MGWYPNMLLCNQEKTVSHLCFQCSIAKAVWAIVAKCIGANNVPKSFGQCWLWCEKWLPYGKQFHTVGIAAIRWAIWKTRNKACFDGKMLKNPASIICCVCALMGYWAGLFPEMDKEALKAGVNTMLQIAAKLLGKKMHNDGRLLLEDKPDDNAQE